MPLRLASYRYSNGDYLQAICDNYELKIENVNSLTNGKAIWCLLDYYFRKELSCSCAPKVI